MGHEKDSSISSQASSASPRKVNKFRVNVEEGPSFREFLRNPSIIGTNIDVAQSSPTEIHPYIENRHVSGKGRKVYFETYGCQMNVNDSDVAWSILHSNGYQRTTEIRKSDVILVMTCAIREGAETKIWKRLEFLKALKRRRSKEITKPQLKIGILGCMAERLKHKLIEHEKMVDLVAGPDSYKDLPRMLAVIESGKVAVNVQLSYDETYADVVPVRTNPGSPSAFVSIMRGCDNMCSFCIVPFTRGQERSRPLKSIVEEIQILSEQGIKEVTLLGQNVNSYRDLSEKTFYNTQNDEQTQASKGFSTIYKIKKGGLRFAELLDQVSRVNPEMRIRFTSPHPKDFPDEVLHVMRDRGNICNQVHLPAQSGSTKVLELMRRGYSREAYLDLVDHIRRIIPDVSLSSDFICGFCGETEDDFRETVSLIEKVKYNFAFLFPYSMREKTHAHRTLNDDVPHETKVDRHKRMVDAFRKEALYLNEQQIGHFQTILIEGISKRSSTDLCGRNDGNIKVIVPDTTVHVDFDSNEMKKMKVGDYVIVKVTSASSQVLKATPICHTTLSNSANLINNAIPNVRFNVV